LLVYGLFEAMLNVYVTVIFL